MSAQPIPIRNLYYLLCYAWDHLPEGEVVDVGRLQSNEVYDLFAYVLINGLKHLIRRGLERAYLEVCDDLSGIRGRVDIVGSARRLQLAHGRATCFFDELAVDTQANRILKSTLRWLAAEPKLDADLRHQLNQLDRQLGGISVVPISSRSFRTIQLNGNNRFYRFLLNLCAFVRNAWLADEKPGSQKFRDFQRDERAMARVFEDFVFNFYRLERPDLVVKEDRIAWQATSETDPSLSRLPQMRTDVSITLPGTKLIIDTKYYSQTFSQYYDSETFRSAHLYQMLAYLMNTPRDPTRTLEGMLLYPQVDRPLRESYTMQGLRIRVCTVDLALEWPQIRADLLELLA